MFEGISRQVKRAMGRDKDKTVKAAKVMEIFINMDTKKVFVRGSLPIDPLKQYEFKEQVNTAIGEMMYRAKQKPTVNILKPPVGFNAKGGTS